MNRASIVALVIGAMLFGCGVGMVAHEVMEPEAVAQEAWTGQQWEYDCSTFIWFTQKQADEAVAEMDKRGSQGWEALSVTNSGETNYYLACYKRPLN